MTSVTVKMRQMARSITASHVLLVLLPNSVNENPNLNLRARRGITTKTVRQWFVSPDYGRERTGIILSGREESQEYQQCTSDDYPARFLLA